MIINHNLPAMNTYRQMGINQASAQNSMTKLSSGLRINRAGDDAAGLAISEKMRGQIRGLDQAGRNAQDGISLIQTAEGGLTETQSILQRMRELATQSANDTNVSVDRAEIQKEMNQLTSEINRIGNTTEFNAQKLLKGKDVAVVSTAQSVGTITAGVTGVPVGATTSLETNAKSVVAVASQTFVQGNTVAATGTVGATAQTIASEAGAKAVASLAGLTFTASTASDVPNGTVISIVQATGISTASAVTTGAGTITFTIGTDASQKSLFTGTDRGSLTNYLRGMTDYGTSGVTIADPLGAASAEPLVGMQDTTQVATAETYFSGALGGGATETRGVNTFSITNKILEVGDTVTVGGQTFTSVASGATASKGEFNIAAKNAFVKAGVGVVAPTTDVSGINADTNITVAVGGNTYTIANADLVTYAGAGKNSTDLINLFKNADNAGTKLSSVASISIGSDNKIEIVANAGGATGAPVVTMVGTDKADLETLTGFNSAAATTGTDGATTGATADDQTRSLRAAINANTTLNARFNAGSSVTAGQIVMTENAGAATGTALSSTTTAGGGADDRLLVTNTLGTNLKTIQLTQAVGDTLAVSSLAGGGLKIDLANASAYKNTAATIQAAVQALGTQNGVDYTKYQFTAQGDWDTKSTGDNITKVNATLVGGTAEVKGDYSFDITKAFVAGDKVNIKGQEFTAVNGGAIGSKGQFDISGGDINLQAASLRDAVSLNSTLKMTYTAGGSGATVNLNEISATGTDLTTADLSVSATGTAGQYSVDVSTILENGAAFTLDDQQITVSNKNANVGYSDGTAIKVAATAADQASALASAINTNATLSKNYTASVDAKTGNLLLQQTTTGASTTAPTVATKNSSIGEFTSTLQVGANAGQSMTLDVNDMRSVSLGISGDGTTSTIAASDGSVASYVITANVTDGTNNTNSEYSLDVSTHEKATAAISVISNAIEAVSAERSKLGAYQNRLEHTISNLGTSSENLTAAESRIRDVDMAQEMTEFSKNNILSQAAQAMLAQANQQPQQVLQLLR